VTELVEVRVPDLGEYKDVEVIDVAAKAGDDIAQEDALLTLETEKATMDVPSPASGRIREVKVKRGDRVSKGDLIALVETTDAGAGSAPAAPATPSPGAAAPAAPSASVAAAPHAPAQAAPAPTTGAPPAPAAAARAIDEPGFSRAHAGPAVRRFARELGVDLVRITGTGLKGRISADDVKAYVKRLLTAPGPAAAVRCLRSPSSTSRNTARSRRSRCRESRRSPARGCTRAGSTSRTSRNSTRRTSRRSRRRASGSRRTRPRAASS